MQYHDYKYDSRYESKFKTNMQKAVEHILDLDYGDTITFLTISQILGFNLDDDRDLRRFKNCMSRIKNFCIDYGKVLKSIPGIGYYVMKPKQIPSYCYRTYIRKTMDLIDKSERILIHTDTNELSEIRMNEYNEVRELNRAVDKNIWATIQTSTYFNNKNEYDSLED